MPVLDLPSSTYQRPLLFVVGCARSGTTWIRSILGAHHNVVTGPESHLFDALYGPLMAEGPVEARRQQVLETYDRSVRGELFSVAPGPNRWVDRDRLSELLDEYLTEGDATARAVATRHVMETIFEEFAVAADAPPDRMVVEKTPRHLYFAEVIFNWWPSARVVEVIRDGRDVCVSLQDKAMVSDWAPAARPEQVHRWVRAILTGRRLRELPVAAERWLTVRYEDLSSDPTGQTRRLLEFACLAAPDDLVSEIAERTSFASLKNTGPGRHQRKGVVGDYRSHFTDADNEIFRELAGDVFEEAGYHY